MEDSYKIQLNSILNIVSHENKISQKETFNPAIRIAKLSDVFDAFDTADTFDAADAFDAFDTAEDVRDVFVVTLAVSSIPNVRGPHKLC